jgi:hypothetical protein
MPPLGAVLVERKPLTFRSGPSWVLFRMLEVRMAKSDRPLVGFSDATKLNFEHLRSRDQELLDSARARIEESWELIARVNMILLQDARRQR